MDDIRYSQIVAKARIIVDSIQRSKLELVKLALEVCDSIHGGAQKDVYTVKKFAEDIGFTVRTLQNWVTNYKRLEKKIPKKFRENVPEKTLFRAASKFNLNTTSKEALQIFKKEVSKSHEDNALTAYIKYAKSMDFFINKSVLLSELDRKDLELLKIHTENVAKGLELFLKKPTRNTQNVILRKRV